MGQWVNVTLVSERWLCSWFPDLKSYEKLDLTNADSKDIPYIGWVMLEFSLG